MRCSHQNIQPPLQGNKTRGKTVGQGHARADLPKGGLRMDKLFRQVSLGLWSDSQRSRHLMAEDQGSILQKMLGDDVLALGDPSRALQGSEGDEGLEEALGQAAGAVPTPEGRVEGGTV